MTTNTAPAIFHHLLTVPTEAIDTNGHVNNVTYIQWMQDVAVLHSEACGGTAATQQAGATWVVRAHAIEYLRPAYVNEVLDIYTWVVDFRRVRSLRRYQFCRQSDGQTLATGETDWVFVNMKTGRPMAIPEHVQSCYPLVPEGR
jgi:acyl-CoA thioester hydrolase